jgi:hypothetical protein
MGAGLLGPTHICGLFAVCGSAIGHWPWYMLYVIFLFLFLCCVLCESLQLQVICFVLCALWLCALRTAVNQVAARN